jgi:hypothetical protein
LSFREKLRRKDISRRDREESLSRLLESLSDDHAMDVDDDADAVRPSLAKIKNFAAGSGLPWEKGAKKSRKAASVIGPAGLACTPLEEAVRTMLL